MVEKSPQHPNEPIQDPRLEIAFRIASRQKYADAAMLAIGISGTTYISYELVNGNFERALISAVGASAIEAALIAMTILNGRRTLRIVRDVLGDHESKQG